MDKVEKSTRVAGLAVTTAMAGVLLTGCAANPAPRADISASAAQEAMAEGRHDRAVRHAEAAVQAEPRNASYRAMLGKVYLDAGRFASAQTSFDDAMELGDNSPRTALSLALSLTAQAKYTEAAALLNDWETEIATADLGLGLALSGQPERGIHLMTNAIRGGENTAKMRQNLAFAYAVAGRWREARLMAEQDVPADQINHRMGQWAELASPLAYQHRVAGLLGVPVNVQDDGQPMHLALSNNPGIDQLASEASALASADAPEMLDASAPELAAVETVSIPVSGRELPAVGRPQVAAAAAEANASSDFEQAFATETPAGGSLAQVAQEAIRFVSTPEERTEPVQFAAAPTPRVAGQAQTRAPRPIAQRSLASSQVETAATSPASQGAAVSAPAAPAQRVSAPVADGSHLVQLGSFSSEQGARRAWGIYVSRYPELSDHEMVITEAIVRGKRYYRVSAGGFDRADSRAMCGRVDASNGDGCISWAAASPLPGAVDMGIRLARR